MSISRVQAAINRATSATSVTTTLSSGVTQGNLLVVEVAVAAASETFTPPSGWTQVAESASTVNPTVVMYYIIVSAGLAGTTGFTWSISAAANVSLSISEWSASSGWAASPLDQSATNTNSSTSTTVSSGTTTTTAQASELWVAGMTYVGGPFTESGLTSGWSAGLETTGGGPTLREVYEIVSSTGAASVSFTITTAEKNAGVVGTFKPSTDVNLSVTFAGVGTFVGTLTIVSWSPAMTFAGVGTLTGLFALAGQLAGVGTFTGTLIVQGGLLFSIGGYPIQVIPTTLSAKSTIGRRGELSCTVYDIAGTRLWQQWQSCQLWLNSGLIWTGYLTSPQIGKPGFQPALVTSLTATDQFYLAAKRIIAKGYRNLTCGSIAQDIVTNILAAEGVTVGSIAPGPIVPVANFGYVPVSQALDALVAAASQSGVQWYWAIDLNKKFWFVPYAAVSGPAIDGTQIDGGQLSGTAPTLTPANPKYRNTQYITGGFTQNGPNDETRQGDGQTRTFTYSYPFAGAPSTAKLNGTTVTVGVKGQSGYQYYYAVGDNTIAQDTGQTVLASTDKLRMVYNGLLPAVYTQQNSAQITAQAAIDGTSGIVEAVVNDTTVQDATTGNAEANWYLSQYAQTGKLFQFATQQSGLQVGQLCTVTYAPYGLSAAQMLIVEIDTTDQADGYNLWQVVQAVQGPYDTNWANFFSGLLQPTPATNNINLGSSVSNPLYPSTTLFPSTTLYPGG